MHWIETEGLMRCLPTRAAPSSLVMNLLMMSSRKNSRTRTRQCHLRGQARGEREEAASARSRSRACRQAMAEPKLVSSGSSRRVQFSRSSTMENIGDSLRSSSRRASVATLSAAVASAAQDMANEAATAATPSASDSAAPLDTVVAPIGGALDDDDAEAVKKLASDLQLEMLRGKLARRNQIIEVIRRAYYHDVVVVKEELRNMKHPSTAHSGDDKLSSVPSVDLRDVLPLFAPSETVLRVHPCEACGGHLELVHGEVRHPHSSHATDLHRDLSLCCWLVLVRVCILYAYRARSCRPHAKKWRGHPRASSRCALLSTGCVPRPRRWRR